MSEEKTLLLPCAGDLWTPVRMLLNLEKWSLWKPRNPRAARVQFLPAVAGTLPSSGSLSLIYGKKPNDLRFDYRASVIGLDLPRAFEMEFANSDDQVRMEYCVDGSKSEASLANLRLVAFGSNSRLGQILLGNSSEMQGFFSGLASGLAQAGTAGWERNKKGETWIEYHQRVYKLFNMCSYCSEEPVSEVLHEINPGCEHFTGGFHPASAASSLLEDYYTAWLDDFAGEDSEELDHDYQEHRDLFAELAERNYWEMPNWSEHWFPEQVQQAMMTTQ